MKVAKCPLRLSLAGGGTDHPTYVNEHGGQCVTGAIDRYVYAIVKPTYEEGWWVKYRDVEHVKDLDDITHPIVREVLRFYDAPSKTEIISLADIPSGTGLGSSGAFTVALCHAVSAYVGYHLDQRTLAQHAAYIELDVLGRGGGVQDHYACAFGGLQVLAFYPNGLVGNRTLAIDDSVCRELQNRLQLYFSGQSREAYTILKTQTTEGLDEIKAHGEVALKMLETDDLDGFGGVLNDHWEAKQKRSVFISNEEINDHYVAGLASGAIGGKLVGAGAGGFLMFYARDAEGLDATMEMRGLPKLPFQFDMQGTRLCDV